MRRVAARRTSTRHFSRFVGNWKQVFLQISFVCCELSQPFRSDFRWCPRGFLQRQSLQFVVGKTNWICQSCPRSWSGKHISGPQKKAAINGLSACVHGFDSGFSSVCCSFSPSFLCSPWIAEKLSGHLQLEEVSGHRNFIFIWCLFWIPFTGRKQKPSWRAHMLRKSLSISSWRSRSRETKDRNGLRGIYVNVPLETTFGSQNFCETDNKFFAQLISGLLFGVHSVGYGDVQTSGWSDWNVVRPGSLVESVFCQETAVKLFQVGFEVCTKKRGFHWFQFTEVSRWKCGECPCPFQSV